MNPFAAFQTVSKPLAARFAARPVLILFVLCLLLGLAVVVWRTQAGAEAGRARALTAAQARSAAVELQLSQALTAAEVLGALATQSGGGISNFQTVALGLLASRPGLASLELQPGGVVSDIVPRTGHERAIGFNVLKDAAQRPGAYAAIQRRVLTVTGPVPIDNGVPGIVVRVPVFQRGRDGRDYFWGFVAVSMRLPEALARARLDELWKQGYSYAFFAPASGQQQGVTIAARGALAFQDAVQQPVRAQNLEFRLALRPRGGWVNAMKVALESAGVLVGAGLLCLLANLMPSRHRTFETAEPSQMQTDRSGVDAVAAVTQAESKLAQLQVRLEETAHRADETNEIAQTRLKQAESSAQELQTRLDATIHEAAAAAQAKQAELEQACQALALAQREISELQGRLEAIAGAESKAAAAAQARPQQNQATIADLQTRLAGAKGSAKEAAEASAAKLNQSEKRNRELAGRLLKAETRVTELSALLQKAPADLKRPQNESARSAAVRTSAPVGPVPSKPKATGDGQAAVSPIEPSVVSSPAIVVVADDQIDLFEGRPKAGLTPANLDARHGATSAPEDSKLPPPELPLSSAATATQKLKELPKPGKPAPTRRLPAPPPVNPAELRKAVNEILPLLADQDPGAKDCLKANRNTFRSAFVSEDYEEFEQFVKSSDFGTALELLKKATKKHGISR